MGVCETNYREIRFVLENELTQVYILVETTGDCPNGIQGWHHKTFPESITIEDILKKMFTVEDDCIGWKINAPK